MTIDIRLPGITETVAPKMPKAMEATPGTRAPVDNNASFSTSFSNTLAALAAARLGKLPALAGDSALPAAAALPQAAAAAPGNPLSALPGLHPLLADSAALPSNPITNTNGAANDALPTLAVLARELASNAKTETAEAVATADLPAASADAEIDTAAEAAAMLQGIGADGRPNFATVAAPSGETATVAGGLSSLHATRPGPPTAAAGQQQMQLSTTNASVDAPATLPVQPVSGSVADSNFALADHELQQHGAIGKTANLDVGPQSGLVPLMNSHGTGQTAVAASASATLASPVTSPQWQQEFSQQMLGLVQRGENRVSLHLNPAELGPLVVDLKLSEHSALLQFASSHAQVRSALEQALPQLREALAEQGISLGEAHIGSERGEQQASAFEGGAHQSGHDAFGTADQPALSQDAAGSKVAVQLDGRVNLYV